MKNSTFMKRELIGLVLLSITVISGCGGGETGGDEIRSTSNSSNLTGLWRFNLESDETGVNANSNFGFILRESSNGLRLTDCITRDSISVSNENDSIAGMQYGNIDIDDNDSLSIINEFGTLSAAKMSTSAKFDMGNLSLSSTEIGNESFTDLCVLSFSLSLFGATFSDSITATVDYNGAPLLIDVVTMGNIRVAEYDLVEEAEAGEATVHLKSDEFVSLYGTDDVTFSSGTLTITEESAAWTRGSFDGVLTTGDSLSGTFSFERP